MKRTIIALILSVFILPSALSQKTVLGTVEYAYNLIGEGSEAIAGMMPEKMVLKYGENGISIEMIGGMMASAMGRTIVNGTTNEAFMVKDSERTVYLMSEEEIDAALEANNTPQVEEMDETKEIMGYNCKKMIQTVTEQGMTVEQILWVTDELATLEYEGSAFKGMAGQSNMNLDIKGFPLLIEVDMPNMPVKLELVVTEIKFEKIDPAEFERPEGYKVKPFAAMNPF